MQVDNGEHDAKNSNVTLEWAWEAWLRQLSPARVRESTRSEYVCIYTTHLKAKFGPIRLRAIDLRMVEQLQIALQDKKLAVRTVNKVLALLSRLFRYAAKHKLVSGNPCDDIDRLPVPQDDLRAARDGNILNPQECEQLIEAAGTPKGQFRSDKTVRFLAQRDPVLFRMAIESGMRQGELLGMRWVDVDWSSCRVYVRKSCRKREESKLKTSASRRVIELTPELLAMLRAWKLACPLPAPHVPEALIFPNLAGSYEDARNLLQRSFHPALRRAGLRHIRFHDLRHSAASLLLAAAVPIKEVQSRLGHASAKMTLDVYGHLMPDAGSVSVGVMAKVFGGKGATPAAAVAAAPSGNRVVTTPPRTISALHVVRPPDDVRTPLGTASEV
jgi:integrase